MNTPATQDTIPRYAPNTILIFDSDGKAQNAQVKQYIAHPANTHPPKCPIKSDMMALELVTEYGSRWYGCEHAYINSELRMVVIGFDSRDEVRRKWQIAEVR